MAATITVLDKWSIGATKTEYLLNIDFDSSYPTGGEAIDISANERLAFVGAQPTSGYVFQWDAANQKLLAYYGDNNNAADGPLIEVPNTTDLSSLTGVRARAIGS